MVMAEVSQPYVTVLQLQSQPGLMHDTAIPFQVHHALRLLMSLFSTWWQKAEL